MDRSVGSPRARFVVVGVRGPGVSVVGLPVTLHLATDHEKDELLAQNQRMEVVDMEVRFPELLKKFV